MTLNRKFIGIVSLVIVITLAFFTSLAGITIYTINKNVATSCATDKYERSSFLLFRMRYESIYSVEENEELNLTEGCGNMDVTAVWERFRLLTPPGIYEDAIFDVRTVRSALAPEQAYVLPKGNSGSLSLVLNMEYLDTAPADEVDSILIHELGHLISLGSDQISPEQNKSFFSTEYKDCSTYYIHYFGCSFTQSYINQFYVEFYDEPHGLFEGKAYVTDYAESNVEEDFAETFEYYVTNGVLDEDSIRAEKTRFMSILPLVKSTRQYINEVR